MSSDAPLSQAPEAPPIDPARVDPARPDAVEGDARVSAAPAPRPPGVRARIVAVMIPLGILAAGVAFAVAMVASRPQATRTEPENLGLPVVTRTLTPSDASLAVRAQGQVIPARQVVLSPEVTGRVVAMDEDLVPGGRVAEGDVLVRLDPRDYRSALQQQRAQVESSRLSLTQEESRRRVAEREWELLGRERGAASPMGRDLALREPQTRAAEASVQAARAALRQARTNLSRTTLSAPFDAFVQSESVDLGQLVGPSSQIATLVATDHFWVQVSVPMSQLAWIRFPDGEQPGSRAQVVQRVGEDGRILRSGRVVRLLGDLDPIGRMARVLVEIDDPLGLESARADRGDVGALPMLLGAFVQVEIEAGELEDVYEIPRDALHADDNVYLFGGGQLAIERVDVLWRRPDSVLARGLEPGAELITSALPTPVEGTRVRHAADAALGAEPSAPPAETDAEAR